MVRVKSPNSDELLCVAIVIYSSLLPVGDPPPNNPRIALEAAATPPLPAEAILPKSAAFPCDEIVIKSITSDEPGA